MFPIIEALSGGLDHTPAGLQGVFSALQALALMRVPAALWLSSDYSYMNFRGADLGLDIGEGSLEKHVSENIRAAQVNNNLLEVDVRDRLLPSHCWQGILYRAFWLLTVWGILGLAATACSQIFWGYSPSLPYDSASHLVWQIMYFVLALSAILIHTFYIIRGNSRSTVIPCIHETWYKIFTILLFIIAMVCTVFSCLETRVRSDGRVSVLPEFQGSG
jgi:hypothetical protein